MPSDAYAAARLRLANGIRTRRRALGLSRSVLAVHLNVHPTYIAMFERGQRVPSFEKLLALAQLLRTPPWEFDQSTPELELADFARSRGLSRRQVDRLIAVGRAMFQPPADDQE